MKNVSSAALRRRRQQLVRALPPLEQIIRVTNRDLQALRSIQLPLQQWPWAPYEPGRVEGLPQVG
jgi:hypothetical protein